jgi:hypothetical protein
LVCLNLQAFDSAHWGQFVADAGIALLGSGDSTVSILVHAWMQNQAFLLCTDLIWFSTERPTLLLLASPFHDRPCGRPLPDINVVCTCTPSRAHPWRQKKKWVVHHNCQDGMPVREVQVTAECSVCRQTWTLPTKQMTGVMCEANDSFSVLAPYFC